jgi:hypothetical protein
MDLISSDLQWATGNNHSPQMIQNDLIRKVVFRFCFFQFVHSVERERESREFGRKISEFEKNCNIFSICRSKFGVFDVFYEELHAEFGP